jgi:hypothetical protein
MKHNAFILVLRPVWSTNLISFLERFKILCPRMTPIQIMVSQFENVEVIDDDE